MKDTFYGISDKTDVRDPDFQKKNTDILEEEKIAEFPEFDIHYFTHSRNINSNPGKEKKTFGNYEIWPKGAPGANNIINLNTENNSVEYSMILCIENHEYITLAIS